MLDLDIKISFTTQGYFLKAIHNHKIYTRLYFDYEIEEAKELFKMYIENKEG